MIRFPINNILAMAVAILAVGLFTWMLPTWLNNNRIWIDTMILQGD